MTEGPGVSVGKEESGVIPLGEQPAPFPTSFLVKKEVLVSQAKSGTDLDSSHMHLPLGSQSVRGR